MVTAKLNGFEPKHKLAGANQQQFGPFLYCRLQICWEALTSETGIFTPCLIDLSAMPDKVCSVVSAGCLHSTSMKGISLVKKDIESF